MYFNRNENIQMGYKKNNEINKNKIFILNYKLNYNTIIYFIRLNYLTFNLLILLFNY